MYGWHQGQIYACQFLGMGRCVAIGGGDERMKRPMQDCSHRDAQISSVHETRNRDMHLVQEGAPIHSKLTSCKGHMEISAVSPTQ